MERIKKKKEKKLNLFVEVSKKRWRRGWKESDGKKGEGAENLQIKKKIRFY